jgi:hypothetical protein
MAKFVQLTFAADGKTKVWINPDKITYFHRRGNHPHDTVTMVVFDSSLRANDEEYQHIIVVAETEEEIYAKLTR